MKRFALCAAVLMLGAVATATVIVPMTVEELTAHSSKVIEGRAMATWSAWDSNHRVILTYTRFNVTKSLKGDTGNEIVVMQLGGTDGQLTQKVSGVRHFVVGENAMLFLRPAEGIDATAVVGLMQGHFLISKNAKGESVASNGVSNADALQDGRVSTFKGMDIPVSTLEARVAQAVGQ
jgi:hypothetical protein